jgi:hypothetical protein
MDSIELKNSIADLVYDKIKEYCKNNAVLDDLELFKIVTYIREFNED